MFERYPDQARDRRHAFWAGVACTVVGILFFWAGAGALTFAFLLPGLLFVLAAIFCSQTGFETAMRIGKFFEWFA
ncbi:hypothetical protein [Pseudomonas nunensis]|uniref:hypothetical protein n=1 Tax=Pseudomonas nunensis TaxID=2961896 RepID=UPI0025AFF0FF|nr:hypothetical protein [Pseudomonas nunensis]MDN3223928.1 hypothetical protein [Pseudomonas nunensis]